MIPANRIVTASGVERVILDVPAADAVRDEAERAGARRVMLVASRSLLEGTDEISQIAAALGDRYAGTLPSIRAHAPTSDLAAATAIALGGPRPT